MIRNIIISTLLLISMNINAQELISLEKCRKMAVESSEDLKIANKRIVKAKAEKAAMRTLYLPNISGSFNGMYIKDNITTEMFMPTVVPDPATGELVPNIMINPATGQPVIGADSNPVFNSYAWLPLEISLKGAYMAGINIEQPIFTGGKIISGNKMASIGLQISSDNKKLQQMNSIVEADQAYWLYVSVNEKVKLAEQAVELLESLVTRVDNSYKVGLVNQNELLKVQVKYNSAILDLQKANSGLHLTRMSLCRVIGLDYSTAIIATDTVISINSDILNNTGNEDVTLRPEYKILSNMVDLEKQNINIARADFLPSAGIVAGYNYTGGIKINSNEFTSGNTSVMMSVKIPIFHWFEGKRKVTSAKINCDIKRYEFEKNSKLLQLEIEQAKLNLNDSYTRIEMANNALNQAEENLKVSNDNYEIGMEVISDRLTAQTLWQQSYSELIDAKIDFKLKETEYLKASAKLVVK